MCGSPTVVNVNPRTSVDTGPRAGQTGRTNPHGDATMTTAQVERAADAFAAALVQWRAERGLSKKRLAAEMGFDPSYISHVEACRHRPTEDFARRAEKVLQAGGMIWQRFREYEDARSAGPRGGV